MLIVVVETCTLVMELSVCAQTDLKLKTASVWTWMSAQILEFATKVGGIWRKKSFTPFKHFRNKPQAGRSNKLGKCT